MEVTALGEIGKYLVESAIIESLAIDKLSEIINNESETVRKLAESFEIVSLNTDKLSRFIV
jgi:hypothetical protein